MALDAGSVVLPGHGTVLIGDPDKAPIDIDSFSITGTVPDGWAISHTSKENPPKFDSDGGKSEQKGSWELDGLAVSTEALSVTVEFNKIQLDKGNFELAFGKGSNEWDEATGSYKVKDMAKTEHAVFIIMTDGKKNAGWYMPRVSLALGDMPEIDVENFFELNIRGDVLTSTTSGLRWQLFSPRPIKAASTAPTVSGSPAA